MSSVNHASEYGGHSDKPINIISGDVSPSGRDTLMSVPASVNMSYVASSAATPGTGRTSPRGPGALSRIKLRQMEEKMAEEALLEEQENQVVEADPEEIKRRERQMQKIKALAIKNKFPEFYTVNVAAETLEMYDEFMKGKVVGHNRKKPPPVLDSGLRKIDQKVVFKSMARNESTNQELITSDSIRPSVRDHAKLPRAGFLGEYLAKLTSDVSVTPAEVLRKQAGITDEQKLIDLKKSISQAAGASDIVLGHGSIRISNMSPKTERSISHYHGYQKNILKANRGSLQSIQTSLQRHVSPKASIAKTSRKIGARQGSLPNIGANSRNQVQFHKNTESQQSNFDLGPFRSKRKSVFVEPNSNKFAPNNMTHLPSINKLQPVDRQSELGSAMSYDQGDFEIKPDDLLKSINSSSVPQLSDQGKEVFVTNLDVNLAIGGQIIGGEEVESVVYHESQAAIPEQSDSSDEDIDGLLSEAKHTFVNEKIDPKKLLLRKNRKQVKTISNIKETLANNASQNTLQQMYSMSELSPRSQTYTIRNPQGMSIFSQAQTQRTSSNKQALKEINIGRKLSPRFEHTIKDINKVLQVRLGEHTVQEMLRQKSIPRSAFFKKLMSQKWDKEYTEHKKSQRPKPPEPQKVIVEDKTAPGGKREVIQAPEPSPLAESVLYQYAYLDKIIRVCELENKAVDAKELIQETIREESKMMDKIIDIGKQISFVHDDNAEKNLKFYSDFHGAEATGDFKSDQFTLTKRVLQSTGSRPTKKDPNSIWKPSVQVYSKQFISKYPELLI